MSIVRRIGLTIRILVLSCLVSSRLVYRNRGGRGSECEQRFLHFDVSVSESGLQVVKLRR